VDDPLVDWQVKITGKRALDELAAIAGAAHATRDTISDVDKEIGSLTFGPKMALATQGSPALGQVLTELAAVRKSAFGVEVAFQQAQKSAAGFDDLEESLRVVNQLFKDSQISAEIAQKVFGRVGLAGSERRGDAAALSDANARAEEAHWAKIDREREDSAKRLAKIAEDNVIREESHWAQVDRERERSAMDLARKQADADVVRRTRIRESITELKTLTGLGVGAGIAAIGMSARSGFQDTLQGQQASAYGQLLNRQVASIFAPLLEEKTKYVAQMTTWLQGLSEPQRRSIQQMTVFGTAMGAAALIVPRVTKALATLATEGALGATLARWTAKGGALGGVAANAGMIGLGIGGLAAILASNEKGREALVDLAKSATPAIEFFADTLKGVTPIFADAVRDFATTVRWISGLIPASSGTPGQENQSAGQRLGSFLADFILNNNPFGIARSLSSPATTGQTGQTGSTSISGVPKGFEDFEAAYTRINEAATKIDLQGQQLAAQQEANRLLELIANSVADTSSTSAGGDFGPYGGVGW